MSRRGGIIHEDAKRDPFWVAVETLGHVWLPILVIVLILSVIVGLLSFFF